MQFKELKYLKIPGISVKNILYSKSEVKVEISQNNMELVIVRVYTVGFVKCFFDIAVFCFILNQPRQL